MWISATAGGQASQNKVMSQKRGRVVHRVGLRNGGAKRPHRACSFLLLLRILF
jgi:hypothetical protein